MSESKFKWDDKKVLEFIASFQYFNPEHPNNIKQLEDFKKSKEVKDYEIVSFRQISSGHIDVIDYKRSCLNINWWLEDKTWEIHSVRRVVDGLVFSVDEITNKGIITGFNTAFPKLVVYFENGLRYCALDEIQKVKPKEVLLTNDGVSIREGDKFWYVNVIGDEYLLCENIAPSMSPSNPNYSKTCFSTVKLAKQYILENKPVLTSYSQIIDFINSDLWSEFEIQKLKEFFKSKINP